MGDFNARIGKNYTLWSGILGRNEVGNQNENGNLLLQFCVENWKWVSHYKHVVRNEIKIRNNVAVSAIQTSASIGLCYSTTMGDISMSRLPECIAVLNVEPIIVFSKVKLNFRWLYRLVKSKFLKINIQLLNYKEKRNKNISRIID